MQNCFREHPDMYGSELDEEETEEALNDGAVPVATETSQAEASSLPTLGESNPKGEKVAGKNSPEEAQAKRGRATVARDQVQSDYGALSETEELVPKSWHDSADAPSKGEK